MGDSYSQQKDIIYIKNVVQNLWEENKISNKNHLKELPKIFEIDFN